MKTGKFQVLPDIVHQGAKRFAHEPAVIQCITSGTTQYSYLQLAEQVNNASAALCGAGLKPGSCVLLILEPRPEWVAAFFAILQAGLVAVPLVTDTPAETITAISEHVQAKAAIVSARTATLIKEIKDVKKHLLVDELFTHCNSVPDTNRIHRQDLALLAYTSGSTQRPRAVELTHANLLADLEAILQVRTAGPGDAFLSILPLVHLFGLVGGMLVPLSCGARVVYPGSLLPNRLIEVLNQDGITHALAVPAFLQMLWQEVMDSLARTGGLSEKKRESTLSDIAQELSRLSQDNIGRLRAQVQSRIGHTFRNLTIGGAALDPAWAQLITPWGIELNVGYGLTEAAPIVSVGAVGNSPPGSVGQPLPGIQVKSDERGEILVRGDNVMRGYYRDDKATKAALTGGWLHTGDCGWLDEQGFLFITGRFKEAMVTSAGETLYPEEVEPYYQNPLFAELCVAPLTDSQGNDIPTLLIVPVSANVGDQEIETVIAQQRAKAPARCRIQQVRRLTGPLPRTATGKIKRRALAEALRQNKEKP